MKFIRVMIFGVLMLVLAGCGGLKGDEVREVALEHLRTEPTVVHEGREIEWEEYFERSRLGRLDGTIPTMEWFEQTPNLVVELGSGVGVNWIGVPGCEMRDGVELRLGYWPEMYDEEGFKCYVWWDVLVTIDDWGGVTSVRIKEVGGE